MAVETDPAFRTQKCIKFWRIQVHVCATTEVKPSRQMTTFIIGRARASEVSKGELERRPLSLHMLPRGNDWMKCKNRLHKMCLESPTISEVQSRGV